MSMKNFKSYFAEDCGKPGCAHIEDDEAVSVDTWRERYEMLGYIASHNRDREDYYGLMSSIDEVIDWYGYKDDLSDEEWEECLDEISKLKNRYERVETDIVEEYEELQSASHNWPDGEYYPEEHDDRYA